MRVQPWVCVDSLATRRGQDVMVEDLTVDHLPTRCSQLSVREC